MEQNTEDIKSFIKKRYGNLAKEKDNSCCTPATGEAPCCCNAGSSSNQPNITAQRLYTSEQIENLPGDVTGLSLGCGNPTAIATLKEGEIVLDLGSGGGIDCFLAAQKVGPRGRVIGLDMTPEMIQLARRNATKIGASNVEFRLGEMEHIPVKDNTVDAIISNCVINLSPDKDAVFREAYRVLKPGGRICVSDIVSLGELPKNIKESLVQWAECISGAINENLYLEKISAAGFENVTTDRNPSPCCSENNTPQSQDADVNHIYPDWRDKVASIRVKAFKPA